MANTPHEHRHKKRFPVPVVPLFLATVATMVTVEQGVLKSPVEVRLQPKATRPDNARILRIDEKILELKDKIDKLH